MYHRVRRKMRLVTCAILILVKNSIAAPTDNSSPKPKTTTDSIDNYKNNVIDFDDEFSVKFSNRYGAVPWHSTSKKYDKESHRYTIVKDDDEVKTYGVENNSQILLRSSIDILNEPTTETDYSVIPLELISTTENYLVSIVESTTDQDLTVIPLSTTIKELPYIEINQTVTLLPSTTELDTTTDFIRERAYTKTEGVNASTTIVQTTTNDKNRGKNKTTDIKRKFEISVPKIDINITGKSNVNLEIKTVRISERVDITPPISKDAETTENTKSKDNTTRNKQNTELVSSNVKNFTTINSDISSLINKATDKVNVTNTTIKLNVVEIGNHTVIGKNETEIKEILKTNSSRQQENVTAFNVDSTEVEEDENVPIFTELDSEDEEVPEDYYDAKDVVPTSAPKTNALSALVGLAGSLVESVVETVAERVVPKGIYDLFKRMQRQNEALESERLRSREENGGLGQFGRGILKTISSGLSKPLSQLMAGAKDIGSLDNDRGFVSSLASGVSSVATVATSVADAFKDRVQAIYPGTVWCGDGHVATARSGELGLFFFTDTCCRQHDACKIYIRAGETKYGLTNTGLFTRSHCSCDIKFRECLRRTNSLVSAQIGLTYFNVLGPQCFRRAYPIVKCLKRTGLTGQKCEDYEFDYSKPKMWQWFDNETF